MQLVGGTDVGPSLFAHPIDRRLIELPELLRGLHVEPASRDHRLGAALLEWRVVEEGVRLGVDHLVRER